MPTQQQHHPRTKLRAVQQLGYHLYHLSDNPFSHTPPTQTVLFTRPRAFMRAAVLVNTRVGCLHQRWQTNKHQHDTVSTPRTSVAAGAAAVERGKIMRPSTERTRATADLRRIIAIVEDQVMSVEWRFVGFSAVLFGESLFLHRDGLHTGGGRHQTSNYLPGDSVHQAGSAALLRCTEHVPSSLPVGTLCSW